LKPNL